MAKPTRGSSASWAAYSNKNKKKDGGPPTPEEITKLQHQIKKNLDTRGGLKKAKPRPPKQKNRWIEQFWANSGFGRNPFDD